MDTPDFGDLRSLMNMPYSRQIWDQLCLWVERWDKESYQAQVRPYLEGHLHQWQDHQRFVPKRWVQMLRRGERPPQGVEIARLLSLEGGVSEQNTYSFDAEKDATQLVSLLSPFAQLTELRLGDNSFHAKLWENLCAHEGFEALRTLSLSHCTIEHRLPLERLAAAPFMATLVELDLSKLSLPSVDADARRNRRRARASEGSQDRAITPLLAALDLPTLQTLRLRQSHLHAEALRALTDEATLPSLHTLELSSTPLLADALPQLDGLSTLQELDLSSCCQTTPGSELHFVSSAPHDRKRSSIVPSRHTWMELLGQCTLMPQLTSLKLAGNSFTAMEVKRWLEGFSSSRMETLDLSRSSLGDEGLEALLEHPVSKSLRSLELYQAELGPRSLELLCASDVGKNLSFLNIMGNDFDEASLAMLDAHPNLSAVVRTTR